MGVLAGVRIGWKESVFPKYIFEIHDFYALNIRFLGK